MSENGRVSLSAIDFLGLVKQRKVARIDLAEAGYEGVIYVRDLTAAEQAKVTASGYGKNDKARYFKDKSFEISLAAMMEAAGPQFLVAAVVTDEKDGEILERAFEAAGPDVEYLQFPSTELVQMADVWIRETGNRAKMEAMLEQTPNAIANLIVKKVRELSGSAEDRIEEKKES